MFNEALHASSRSFNLPCVYVEPRTAAARRQRKGYANYPRVVLDKLLSQALKSKKKVSRECVGFFPERRNVAAAMSAGEILAVCAGRLLEVVSSE